MNEPSRNAEIGPYHVLGVLGEGGMGVVYAAEQRRPISRRVALKVIKVGMDTKEVLARFEVERQALALLDHPNIARVLDAGATAEGRPFFAMELVRGLPITRYCDEGRLPVRARVEVFLQACAAIQHAHDRNILHRDLKPSNLLVTEVDGRAVVKVIDFGLAKAMNQRLTERTLFTEEGRIIGTPEYMSPEQAETSAQDVDARSDVFSLGVVLYELIAGALPFDFQTARAKGYFEVQRCIREDEPPTPRQRLGSMHGAVEQVLALRRCRMQELATSLKNGLDAVTMKAIAKSRGDRYASCAELAADLRRFLANEPVLARRTGLLGAAASRLRRFRRRHGGIFAALVLAFGVGVGTWWVARARADSWSAGDTASWPVRQGSLRDGLQTGEWQSFYESGKIRARGRYDADQQVGIWTLYHENGSVDRNGAYDRNGRTGEWIFYQPDGALQARGSFVDDVEDGVWAFFDGNGEIERVGQFDRGVMSGPWRYQYPGGKPKAEGMYHRGRRIGPWQTWDPAGAQGTQSYLANDESVLVLEKWPTGRRRRAGILEKGQPVGRWTTWHEDGPLRFCATLTGSTVSGAFEARLPGGGLLAKGAIDSGEFVEASVAMVQGKEQPIAAGRVPAATGVWFSGDDFARLPPEHVVGALCAELAGPIDASDRVVMGRDAVPPPAANGEDRRPAPIQAELTVRQREEMEAYVRAYTEGPEALLRRDIQERLPRVGRLKDASGTEVDLRQILGKKRVLLVILRFYGGEVCTYCCSQTKALVELRGDLDAAGVEALVVFPGPKENEESFRRSYATTFGAEPPPYRVFYDADMTLLAALGLQDGFGVKSSTILVDESGVVRHASSQASDRKAAKDLPRIVGELKH